MKAADMSKALSMDLGGCALAAVSQRLSHRTAAERFEVSAASISRWRKLEREQGDVQEASACVSALLKVIGKPQPSSER